MLKPIQVTEKASNHINALLSTAPEGTQGLRLAIKQTGCSGHSYSMDFIKSGEDLSGDEPFENFGATLYIPKKHSWMLFGMEIDYIMDDLGNERFDFKNPNETGRCGCGESFHVEPPQEPKE